MGSLILNPIAYFTDLRGKPLNDGSVYIGAPNTNPVTNQITVYQDAACTIPLAQPLGTVAGYTSLNGSPQPIYTTAASYSLLVNDKHGCLVISYPDYTNPLLNEVGGGGATQIGFDGTTLDQVLFTRLNRVFDSIAALRALTSIQAYTHAFVTGYYAAHDGGGGPYQVDPNDTTSADNGATIIVDANGRRWKLQHMGTLSVKQCGAYGDWNGTTGHDDTTAVNTWLSIILAATGPKRGYAPAGTYKCSSQITMNWGTVGATGATFIGDGKAQSVFDLSSVTTSPAWLMTDSSGSEQEFYGVFTGLGIKGNLAGIVLQIGQEAFGDAFNECEFDIGVTNASTNTSACAVELNGLYNCDIFIVANCAGHGDAFRARQMQFSRVFGSFGNADTAIHLTGGYVYGNTFQAIDHEVCNTGVVIDGSNVVNNTWLGGQFVWNNGSGPAVAAINATAGSNNRFIGPNFGNPGTIALNAVGIVVYSQGNSIGTENLGGLTLSPPTGDGALTINSVSANSDDIVLQQAGVPRWMWQRDTSANLNLVRLNSSGTQVDEPISIEPTQGVVTVKNLQLQALTNATATSATGGGASGLPSAPAGYLTFTLGTSPTVYKIPFYNT
ncbi:phage tailspike protein [Burkholderia cepacia]|uniref:phage tailspike protein n=1 Tax=Burkholderia cepacia TaxID=292 RepID=UPI00398E68C9